MKFCLVDRILSLDPGKRIVAVKSLSMAEEYLGDHFPTFPVLPGVLMLEGLVQAAGWLVQVTTDFRYGRILLREAKAVKYGRFVVPGATLRIEVDAVAIEETGSRFKGVGLVDGEQAVSARLVLEHRPVEEPDGCGGEDPEVVRGRIRQQFRIISAGLVEPAEATEERTSV